MQRSIVLLSVLLSILLTSECAVQRALKARAGLQKCTFELVALDFRLFDVAPTITFHNSEKKFSIAPSSLKKIIPFFKELKAHNFDLSFTTAQCSAQVKIYNPNTYAVALDSLSLATYLDTTYVAQVTHAAHTNIPPKSSHIIHLNILLPTTLAIPQLLSTQQLKLTGKVWLHIPLIGSSALRIPLPLTVTQPLPRTHIIAAIRQEKDHIISLLLEALEESTLLKKAESMLKELFK